MLNPRNPYKIDGTIEWHEDRGIYRTCRVDANHGGTICNGPLQISSTAPDFREAMRAHRVWVSPNGTRWKRAND